MSLGERATLNISADFGYGSSGAGADIPPNADLKFDVRVVAINGKQSFYSEKHAENFAAKLSVWKEKELTKYDTKEGYQGKKDAKHTDKAGFEAWLDAECEKNQATVVVKPSAEW